MFKRMIALLVAGIVIYAWNIPIAECAQSPLERFSAVQNCFSGGRFESWSPSGQLILLNDNHFVECDLENGADKPTNYSPPRTAFPVDELKANSQKSVVRTFPDVITNSSSSTSGMTTWTHVAPLFFKYDDNYLAVEKRLLSSDQGELGIYTAAPIAHGSGNGRSIARFAFAYRKDAKYKLIEIEAQPHKAESESGYPWGHLTSSVDYTTGRLLIFLTMKHCIQIRNTLRDGVLSMSGGSTHKQRP